MCKYVLQVNTYCTELQSQLRLQCRVKHGFLSSTMSRPHLSTHITTQIYCWDCTCKQQVKNLALFQIADKIEV